MSRRALADFLLERIADTELECDLYGTGPDASGRVAGLLRRQCGAMRRIVDLHRPDEDLGMFCTTCGDSFVRWPCPTLRAAAYVHADHPDFRPEWAPSELEQP